MHGPAVYAIAIILFVLSGLLLFAAGSSWAKVARRSREGEDRPIPRVSIRAAAGLTAASLGLLGAAILWSSALVFFLRV